VKIRLSRDKAKKTERDVKKLNASVEETEKRRASLLDKKLNLEQQVEELAAKSRDSLGSSSTTSISESEKSRLLLEKTLASLTTEHAEDREKRLSKLKVSHSSKVDDMKKKAEREKEKNKKIESNTTKRNSRIRRTIRKS